MTYLIPIIYVLVPYVFFLMMTSSIELHLAVIPIPLILGILNLIIVLTAGRRWSRKTLLNCTLIIKYGLIPFYLLGGCAAVSTTVLAIFPLPFMALFGILTALLLSFGYVVLLGSAPYAISYLIKSYKEEAQPLSLVILSIICQFFFIFDVIAIMVLTIKERYLVKTTVAVCISVGICILLSILAVALVFLAI